MAKRTQQDQIKQAVAEALAELVGGAISDEPTDEEKADALFQHLMGTGTFERDDEGTVIYQPAAAETAEAAEDESADEPAPTKQAAGQSLLKLLKSAAEKTDKAKSDEPADGKDNGEWKFTDWGDPAKRAARYAELAAEKTSSKEASNG